MKIDYISGIGSGTGSGCTFNNPDPVPQTHGGLEAGTNINGMNPCQVLEMILYPYQYPSFTSFYIEGQNTILEVGDKITGGIRTFRWSTSHPENIQPNSIVIRDNTEGYNLAVNLANDGIEDLDIGSDKVRTTPGNHRWTIAAHNTKNQTFTRNFIVYWKYRVYWGESSNSTLTESEVKSLSHSQLKDDYTGFYNFISNGTPLYFYIVYPDSWGDINNWVDIDTGFGVDYTYTGTVDITNDYGVTTTYRLLRTTYQQTANLNSQVS